MSPSRAERGLADSALRRRHGAHEGRIVVVVRDQPQVRDEVLDLGLVEQRLPAGHVVRHVLPAQCRLEHARLVVAAIEDGEIGEFRAPLEFQRRQPAHDRFGFGFVIGRGNHADGLAVAEVAPQALVEELRIVADQRVRRAQDAHRRAVVLLELDDLEIGIVARQAREVVDGGAAPAVDRLVVVADRGERRGVAHQRAQQPILRRIGVLVFVDEHVRALGLPARARVRVALEQLDDAHDEVVEVHRLVGGQRLAVVRIGARRDDLVVVLRLLQRRGRRAPARSSTR